MNPEQWTKVDGYITDLFVSPDPALEATVETSMAAGLPAIQVTPNQGKLLHLLARAMGARRILELGTLGGYSTIWLARALPADGRLITLEANPRHAEVAQANLVRAGLADRVEIRLGQAIDVLPGLLAEGSGPFDFIFIDADKANYPGYFQWSLQLARPGTMIIADNVVRQGGILDADSADANIQGARRFNELVAAEPRVSATALQTVTSKGYDGFALAVVIEG